MGAVARRPRRVPPKKVEQVGATRAALAAIAIGTLALTAIGLAFG